MRAGMLRHRVTIQSNDDSTQDALGQPQDSWSTDSTSWASISPLNGRELEYAKATHADTTHKITIRYVAAITPEKRIQHNGRTFNILSVIDVDEMNEKLILMAKESV